MKIFTPLLLSAFLAVAPAGQAMAATPAAAPAATDAPAAETPADDTAPADVVADTPVEEAAAPDFDYAAPDANVGLPKDAELYLPDQYSETGQDAMWLNDVILMPMMFIISIFVLLLLVWVIVRFNKRANKEASRTSHNTLIEVLWTLIPVLILVIIAVPSIRLIAKQYETAPADSVYVKVTGAQWYWKYEYPDLGIGVYTSNMLKEKEDAAEGDRFRTDEDGPRLLAVDNRMVVPVGVPIRIQTTADDVIHSFAVPSLWFKLDSIPGRLNERKLTITKPGVYYGQCSELCGARHAFMPIVVEAVPPAQFARWVASQGGTMPGEDDGSEAVKNEPKVEADSDVATAGEAAAAAQ